MHDLSAHKYIRALGVAVVLAPFPSNASPAITQEILQEYQAQVAEPLSAEAGAALWIKDFNGRSCTSCHTDSVLAAGTHKRTGKVIQPMAPSRNPERLTDRKKIKKWFLRNCKWTLGRECSAWEQGNILLWLSKQ